MDVAVFGLGYIGLPTAAMLANAGHRVTGIDVDARRIDDIRSGCAHVSEVDVRLFVQSAVNGGRLSVSTTVPETSDAYIICVPTPSHESKPDLRFVEQASGAIAERAKAGDLIVLESTVPPGTVENVIVRSLEAYGKVPDTMYVAHCPERVIPGAILRELRENARVIGGRRPVDAQKARDLYGSFCKGDLYLTDSLTAELVKIVENTFRDVNLAFANELATMAESLGVDVWEVIRLANKHPRVNILNPGPGVGGHCIPVDPTFLTNTDPFLTELIQAARRVNARMPHVVARLLADLVAPVRTGAQIALLGAAYKADVDDTRESPALELVHLLLERGHHVTVFDPYAHRFDYPLAPSLYEAVLGADAIALITDHRVFSAIDPATVASLVRRKAILDTRNVIDRRAWSDAGFTVRTLGMGWRQSGTLAVPST